MNIQVIKMYFRRFWFMSVCLVGQKNGEKVNWVHSENPEIINY